MEDIKIETGVQLAASGSPEFVETEIKILAGENVLESGSQVFNVELSAGANVVVTEAELENLTVSSGAIVDAEQTYAIPVRVGQRVLVDGYNLSDRILKVNNPSNVKIVSGAKFAGDITVSAGERVSMTFALMQNVRAGARVIVSGIRAGVESVKAGANIILTGGRRVEDTLTISNGSRIDYSTYSDVSVRSGAHVDEYGYKLTPNMGYVLNGANIQMKGNAIFEDALKVFSGASINLRNAYKAADLTVSAGARVYDFRGLEVYYDDLAVKGGVNITMVGKGGEGVTEPVATLCNMYDVSLNNSKPFVQGQFDEIVKIPFDSSANIGVKLYSCDNKRVNVSTTIKFASFHILFDNQEVIYQTARIDPVSNTISITILRGLYQLLERNKVYDMQFRIADLDDNSSIIFQRKLRFN
ncbi:hypothetical protein [Yersinia phage vB_YenM_P778]